MHRCGLYPAHSSDVLPPRTMVGRAGRVASEAVSAWAIPDIAGRVWVGGWSQRCGNTRDGWLPFLGPKRAYNVGKSGLYVILVYCKLAVWPIGLENQMIEGGRVYRADLLHQGIKNAKGEEERKRNWQGSGGDGGCLWNRKKPEGGTLSRGSNSTQEGRETIKPHW